MKHRTATALGALIVLAGCGGGEPQQDAAAAENASAAEAAGAAAPVTVALRPGEYEVTAEAMGQKSVERACLTQEYLDRSNGAPLASEKSRGCSFDDVRTAGGKIEGTMVCSEGERSVKMTLDGSQTATSYDMNMKAEMDGMTMMTSVSGRRIGDCPANAAKG